MKKEVTPEIIKRLNDALDAVCKYLTEENYNEVNKFQEEYYRVMSMIFFTMLMKRTVNWDKGHYQENTCFCHLP